MPLFSPRRYQPAYLPYKRDSAVMRVYTWTERQIKSALFGCRMCGNCLLQETAFICPMSCPKGLRNGPCGGSTPEACYVDPTRPCTWYEIYKRAERMGRLDRLLEVLPPVDGRQAGHEAILDVFSYAREHHTGPFLSQVFKPAEFSAAWDKLFYGVRQPEWWQGDDQYHPPAYEEPVSQLEADLRTGRFTVTCEIAPPLSMNQNGMRRKIQTVKKLVSAANFTDNASATPRTSSLASCVASLEEGLEPVLQLQARDRGRYAIEAEAMGASALGIRNILCLSGDHLRLGPGPTPRPVQNDMDAIQMLWMLRRMRDEGIYLDGRAIKTRPAFFLGAAASPYAAIPRYEAIRTEKKVNAGAQFIQTQPIFDYDRFLEWLAAIENRNLFGKVHILAGIVPLKSARAAHLMADEVPGVVIPDNLIKRMDEASDPQEEGVSIALEILEKLKHTDGLSGIHIMALHWEEIVPRLLEESGLV
ncbi:MAG: methylenetetrahydrofolate reductase C-terminal domain-containing protein [Anaerolineales bacterium]|nr:methylenetetrahydrofolate reductase C-terminal domain-containing protein [Anaerolineales bacterium]